MTGRTGVCALLALWLGLAGTAQAQLAATTGTVTGRVTNKATGEALPGVTVVASSTALQGTQAELTDSSGQYTLSSLPPGVYVITFYYSDITVRRSNIQVRLGGTVPVNVSLDPTASSGEVIEIVEKAPAIDIGSTKQVTTVDEGYTKNIPVPGRNYTSTLGAAPGSQGDALGVSFSGSQSLENSYIIDGVNTTGVLFGTIGSPLLNNFIQEIEIITGGYDAEFGRSTGGVINVVTKTGSNEFHGQVFTTWEPGFLEAEREPIFSEQSSITAEAVPDSMLGYLDFGFDLGGPIVKDKVWFYVAFAPILTRTDIVRKINTRVDREDNFNDYNRSPDADGDPMTSNQVGCELTQSCESDGLADLDPRTGFTRWEEVERRSIDRAANQFQIQGKVNFALSPDHQGAVSLFASPTFVDTIFVNGTPSASEYEITNNILNGSAKWTSKFFDNRTQVDAIVGVYQSDVEPAPKHETTGNGQFTRETPIGFIVRQADGTFMSLGLVGRNDDVRESDTVLRFCTDGSIGDPNTPDPFPTIKNCPIAGYRFNGAGFFFNDLSRRVAGGVQVTERIKAAGHHTIKAGIDFEDNSVISDRTISGGRLHVSGFGVEWQIQRLVRMGVGDDECGDPATPDNNGDGIPDGSRRCEYLDEARVTSNTFNWAAFLQDKWQILPNLTVSAGLRYEEQVLRYADEIRGAEFYEFTAPLDDPNAIAGSICQAVDNPATPYDDRELLCNRLGKNAMELRGNFAPRIGVLYDWTKEGRAKVYANWGRFYESIPLLVNDAAFSGETVSIPVWDWNSQCGDTPLADPLVTQANGDPIIIAPSDPANCPQGIDPLNVPGFGTFNFGSGTLVAPGTKAQYLDEWVLGSEYEVLEDLVLGASIQSRRLGRVIEDVSIDGGETYFIANPGQFDPDEETRLEKEIAALDTMDPRRRLLWEKLEGFKRIRRFPKPRREYGALQLVAKKRFSRNFFVQASYTYSRTEGNHPGLFQPSNGQVAPNINTQYDLLELLANRDGRLPQDRPHNIKVDGYYNFDLREHGVATIGGRLRALSGIPIDALGSHYNYGDNESFLIPRGTAGRTEFVTEVDLHLAYGRTLGRDMFLEVYFDVFNIFNDQVERTVDDRYTFDNANPVVGGTLDDLKYVKQVDLDGFETGETITKNRNHGNTTSRLTPVVGRFGLRLTF